MGKSLRSAAGCFIPVRAFQALLLFNKEGENMRKITAGEIAEAVRRLCVEANRELPAGLEKLVRESPARESSGTGRAI